MTIKRYLINSETKGKAIITAIQDGEHPILRLNQTWFHPQGGGQKADRGTINEVSVIQVKHSNDGEVDHYVSSVQPFQLGQEVELIVDQEWRLLNSKYHLAGHLIAALMEKQFPSLQAISGHHWPNEARVEFTGDAPSVEQVSNLLSQALTKAIESDLSVQICGEPLINRLIKIGDFPAVPCGGTHPEHLGLLNQVHIADVKNKKGKLRVSYSV
jgi:Ser-tRNA(Ala) deacylase AlaX